MNATWYAVIGHHHDAIVGTVQSRHRSAAAAERARDRLEARMSGMGWANYTARRLVVHVWPGETVRFRHLAVA